MSVADALLLRLPSTVHAGTTSRTRARVDTGSLPRLNTVPPPGEAACDLVLGDLLGAGGMGVVTSAEQLALRRGVAVKRAREGATEAVALVCEARILGALEHPNIVPVYALGRDEAGAPMMVMKRIDGAPWSHRLRARPSGDARDALDAWIDAELETLMLVCNAVHFAHTRSVIHRDLKPDNVIVGDFGAVYVVDWGIAASLVRDDPRGLPSLADVDLIAGTPAYMAPEVLRGDPLQDARADVYLLGAMLHDLLVGAPPRSVTSLDAAFAVANAPEVHVLPDALPRALADLCLRALSHEPRARPPSAEAFRAELAQHLAHRASASVAREAIARLVALEGADGVARAAAELRVLHAECRFGFEHALRGWPENPAALEGKARATLALLRLELRERNLATAEQLAREIGALDSDDAAALEQLRDQQRRAGAEMHALRALAREHDQAVAIGPRSWLLLGIVIAWGLVPITVSELRARGLINPPNEHFAFGVPVAFAATIALVAALLRRNVLVTAVNRRFISALLLGAAAELLNHLVVYLYGWSLERAVTHDMVLFSAVAGLIAVAVDPRAIVMSVCFGAGAVVAALRPSWSERALGVAAIASGVAFFATFIVTERRKARRVGSASGA